MHEECRMLNKFVSKLLISKFRMLTEMPLGILNMSQVITDQVVLKSPK